MGIHLSEDFYWLLVKGTHARYPKVVPFGNDPIEATSETPFCPIIDTRSNSRVRPFYCQIAATAIDFPEATKATDTLAFTHLLFGYVPPKGGLVICPVGLGALLFLAFDDCLEQPILALIYLYH